MTHMTNRRTVLAALAASALAPLAHAAARTRIEVWKDEGCGCCDGWVQHLEANGFEVKLHDGGHHPVRNKMGIGDKFASCHTGIVGGYAIEGHVPAREIRRLLAEKPNAIGLTVPRMPIGTPGMDGPEYKGRRDAYDVLLLARSGDASVYQHYEGAKR